MLPILQTYVLQSYGERGLRLGISSSGKYNTTKKFLIQIQFETRYKSREQGIEHLKVVENEDMSFSGPKGSQQSI